MISIYFKREHNTLNRQAFASKGIKTAYTVKYVNGLERNLPGSTSINQNVSSNSHYWFNGKFEYETIFPLGKYYRMGFSADAVVSTQSLSVLMWQQNKIATLYPYPTIANFVPQKLLRF